jgi:ElaB/YqjD/DUF883 family membrane-anchored ribosome-binding protein
METIDKVASTAHEAVDRLAGATGQAAATLGEKGQQLKNAEQRLMENARGYTRDNPMVSLGIAVAAGFVLSRLFTNGRQMVSEH